MHVNASEHAADEALRAFQNGFHCAESVSLAVARAFGDTNFSPSLATGFGGGIGRSFAELCGAFTGGVLAIGALHGRTVPGDPRWKDSLAPLTAAWRETFLREFGSLSCPTLLARLSRENDFAACKNLASQAAGLAAGLIADYRATHKL